MGSTEFVHSREGVEKALFRLGRYKRHSCFPSLPASDSLLLFYLRDNLQNFKDVIHCVHTHTHTVDWDIFLGKIFRLQIFRIV